MRTFGDPWGDRPDEDDDDERWPAEQVEQVRLPGWSTQVVHIVNVGAIVRELDEQLANTDS